VEKMNNEIKRNPIHFAKGGWGGGEVWKRSSSSSSP
jgi:hypothetical protein